MKHPYGVAVPQTPKPLTPHRSARHHFGAALRAARVEQGMSQAQLARMVHVHPDLIAKVEKAVRWPTQGLIAACDKALGKAGPLLELWPAVDAERSRGHQRLLTTGLQAYPFTATDQAFPADRATSETTSPQLGEAHTDDRLNGVWSAAGDPDSLANAGGEGTLDVLNRVHRLSRMLDPAILDHVADELQRYLAHYDSTDHRQLTATLVTRRAWLDLLLEDCPHPRQREQLFNTASLTSGLLGYLAVGRSAFGLARAYCLEAFQLAEFVQDLNLQAWVRGMQSFCEYYAGDYPAALRLALDGADRAGNGPQAVRLMINGVARAAGKLGDAEGVRRAVGRAQDLMPQQQAPAGVPSSIGLGCYSPAQLAGNAATAFVSLGKPADVQYFVGLAMPDVSRSASPWSRSLVTLDLATALIRSSDHDLDHATALALDALAISRGRPIVSVMQRTHEFVRDAADRWGTLAQTESVREALATLGRQA